MSIGRVPGATGIQPSIVDAKGDIIAATAADSVSRLAVGTNNQVLTADSAEATGLKYANEARATLTTTGDLLYASAANTPARLAIGSTDQVLKVSGGIPAWGAAPAASFVGASIYNTTSFSISNNTATRITMNSEFFDSDSFHDTSTNTARMTIPTGKGGKYLVCMRGTYDAGSTAGYRSVSVYKNGASLVELSFTNAGSNNQTSGGSVIISLVAGDYIEMFTQQNSGTTLTFYAREYEHPFQVQYLGA